MTDVEDWYRQGTHPDTHARHRLAVVLAALFVAVPLLYLLVSRF
jgi:hypothetical protein